MPSRTLDLMLLDTCDIERYTETQGPIGEQVKTWTGHLAGVKFRLVYKEQVYASPDVGLQKMIEFSGIFEPGIDVKQEDRLVNIQASIPSSGTFRIEQVIPRRLFGMPSSIKVILEKV